MGPRRLTATVCNGDHRQPAGADRPRLPVDHRSECLRTDRCGADGRLNGRTRMGTAGRLLLVEDDDVIGEATQLNLQRYDYDVAWERDGVDAWRTFSDAAADKPFDIVVCDVMLPG